MEFWAHSGTSEDHHDWQPLVAHLRQVAALAEERGQPLGLGRAAALAGLLHDLGKYAPEVQRRIAGADIRVDHSTAGGAVLLSRMPQTQPGTQIAAELLAYAILGHHAGLPDQLNGTDASLRTRVERFGGELNPAWEDELSFDLAGLGEEVLAKVRRTTGAPPDPVAAAFDLSLVARMVFSCLVDADFRDTEAYYAQIGRGPAPDRGWPALQVLLPDLLARFDAHMAEKTAGAKDNPVNHLRREVLTHVRGKAGMAPGVFTLTVPTGGGKTLASLAFALDHALAHGLRRIVYAIPFTSIIDQTAAIFREVLGDGVVLEHHSALDQATRPSADGSDETAGRDKLKLAMEDWAAPVVVTTNVQLFESLFAARPSRTRKLHNLGGSVIVLDEAQAIPRPFLEPCVRMIDLLARHYGTTVVLCTATQPAFDRGRLALPIAGRELAPDPKRLAATLRRARIVRAGPMEDEALVAALASEPQALVIVGSRPHALELFRAARGLEGVVHLSTRQCAAHRRAVLAEVRRLLVNGQPCRVIATSLVEAGVDLDFPKVWRAEAGLDSIVQAAGRCNREGRRTLEESVVTVFSTPGRKPPAEVAALAADMGRMLDRHDDLLAPEAIEDYFGEVYWRLGDGLDAKGILRKLTVSRMGTDFAFRSIAADFRLIEDEMAPVIVPWEGSESGLGMLHNEAIGSGGIARALQPFVVQVPPRAREALLRNGHVAFLRPDLRGEQFAVLQEGSRSLYDREVGLIWEDAERLPGGGIV